MHSILSTCTFPITLMPFSNFSLASHSLFTEKIKQIAYTVFKGGSSIYLSSLGSSEILQSLYKKINTTPCESIAVIKTKAFSPSNTYLYLHGGLTLNSGFFNLLGLLNEFGVVRLGSIANVISAAGSVLFLCANIVALEENIRLYKEVANTDWTQTNIDKKELNWLKQSAAWGILSNVGYILATATLLFSNATAIALIIALLSSFSGGIKILFDVGIWLNFYT